MLHPHVSQFMPEHSLSILFQVDRPDKNPAHQAAGLLDSHIQHQMNIFRNYWMGYALATT
jgi:hypothetical protein